MTGDNNKMEAEKNIKTPKWFVHVEVDGNKKNVKCDSREAAESIKGMFSDAVIYILYS